MRKIVVTLAALAAIGLTLPYAAPAKAEETVIIHKHRHHVFVPLPHRSEKTVIIRHGHDYDRD